MTEYEMERRTGMKLGKEEKHNIGYEITMEVVLKGNIEDTFSIE